MFSYVLVMVEIFEYTSPRSIYLSMWPVYLWGWSPLLWLHY